MSDATSVLIVAPNWLGDAVMALPAVADVRRAYPRARLVVAARPPVAPLYAMVPGVDGAVVLQWGGALLDRGRLRDDAARLQAEHPDVAILFPNSFSSAWLTREAGVPERWGYAADLRRPLLTRAVARPRESVHQGTYYQRLVARLGIDSGPLEPAIAVSAKAVDAARAMLAGHGWNPASPLIVMAPGAAYGTAKRWLPEHFGTLITRMVSERRAQVAIVGSAADAGTSRLVIDAIAGPQRADAIDLTGATTLEALAAVMSLAMVCVSNDSGAMHLAAAAGTPLIALFGPTRDRETSPLPRAGGRARVLANQVWCRPCMLRECPIDHRCMAGLSPDRVFVAVRDLTEVAS